MSEIIKEIRERSDQEAGPGGKIPAGLLKESVYGINLNADTLDGNISADGTLLVFLRHFGCIFCREMVADLRQHASAEGERDRILFFFQGTVPEGREFFTEHWSSARAIADRPLRFYQGFGIPKGSMAQIYGPQVWRKGMQAFGRGHRPGLVQGNVRQMPGFMWVKEGRILWRHDFEHAGDNPNLSSLPFLSRSV